MDIKERAKEVSKLLKTLSNENRLLILCMLIDGPMTVNSLTKELNITQSAVSQHLSVLSLAGIIDYEKKGQNIYYFISDNRVVEVFEVLKRNYCQ